MDAKDLVDIGEVVAEAIVLALVYAMPAILASWWRQRRQEWIAVLNLLLGWTGVGWLALLAYVVGRRIRATRSPIWRNRSRGAAPTERQRQGPGALALAPQADLNQGGPLR